MNYLTAGLCAATLFLLTNCSSTSNASALSTNADRNPDAETTDVAQVADEGDLVVTYVEPSNSDYTEVYEILQQGGFYDELISNLNDSFAFPQDIAVVFDECGEENAFYSSDDVQITMCYELIKSYADTFQEEYQEDYAQEVNYAGFFTFFHELGHAMVDQYSLPVVGREEDAVDSFAAVLMLQADEQDAAIAGMEQFDVDATQEAELDELPFWDEHSLSEQRVYNVACLIYGSNPEEYADFIESEWLPEDRADGCEAEYEQASNSWNTLLEPYYKGS